MFETTQKEVLYRENTRNRTVTEKTSFDAFILALERTRRRGRISQS